MLMLGDNSIHPPEQYSISMEDEYVSSPILSGQILEFCESELVPAGESIQNSEEVAAANSINSNCCYDDDDDDQYYSSYTSTTASCFSAFPPADLIKYPRAAPNSLSSSIIFDINEEENDNININSVNNLDFNQQLQFDPSPPPLVLLQNHPYNYMNIPRLLLTTDDDHMNTITPHQNDHVMGNALMPTVCEVEDDDCCCCLSSKLTPGAAIASCSLMQQDPLGGLYDLSAAGNYSNPSDHLLDLPAVEGIFGGNNNNNNNFFLSAGTHQQLLLDFKGSDDIINILNGGAIFNCTPHPDLPTPAPAHYNSNQLLQAQLSSNDQSQHGGASNPLTSENITSSLEAETNFRAKLTTQERKQKIHRYINKRNHRNFTKKIKYACRKTLADSRPRVRGRFAKNDEFGDNNNNTTTTCCSNNEQDTTDEDVKSFHVIVKEEEEEEENFESSSDDIFAHISGVNSFKCNYQIQSWIS